LRAGWKILHGADAKVCARDLALRKLWLSAARRSLRPADLRRETARTVAGPLGDDVSRDLRFRSTLEKCFLASTPPDKNCARHHKRFDCLRRQQRPNRESDSCLRCQKESLSPPDHVEFRGTRTR